ncbi:CAF17-like 4Fe-4S cluster assembly/insertion protein YgfZ [Thiolapillus sp.]
MNLNAFVQTLHLEQAPAEADCALTAPAGLGLIRIQGEDARDFLQGQLTNDINKVCVDQAQLSAWCTPKGRMLALMLIFQRDDDLYLQLPAERIEPVLKRLGMFVLRSKVTLEDASSELGVLAMGGDCITGLFSSIPETDFASLQADGLTIIRFPGEVPRIQIIGDVPTLSTLRERTGTSATVVGSTWWTVQNIRSGVPSVYDATAEAFVPQMLNLDILNGISFTKGCYTGQEVVARMKYLGQLKRRMYLARFDAKAAPQPGDNLFSPQSKSAQGAGKIVDAAPSTQGGWEALVVAQTDIAEGGDLFLGDADGPRLALQPPPYGLEAPE